VLVTFDGPDDPYNPINWPFKKKVITTVLYGFTTMGSTWASSVFSPAISQVASDFHVGTEVSSLGISLLLFGFGLGPLIWAPLSEVYGRKPAVLAPYFLAAVFSFATATAKDIQTVLITRFFAGLFGSAPVTNTVRLHFLLPNSMTCTNVTREVYLLIFGQLRPEELLLSAMRSLSLEVQYWDRLLAVLSFRVT
jgi:MFS family permease